MKTLTPKDLFIGFSKIGMSGFGGVLPWARRTIVEQEKWLTAEEFSAMLGICQIVPGPNIVNLGVCVGSRFAGIPGAIAAVLGLMLGPVALLLILAVLYEHYSYMPIVQGMLRGVSAVGVGLIASTGFKMLRTELKYPLMLSVIIFVILAATVFHLGLGWVVLLASPLAILLAWKKTQK
ncbi:MAG: chromate transporter [Polynucleobacter sp.]|uniref:chromate transporter n=1 Tax=Polynucleobacter sp. TaxID=2029855 RepID=UPI0021724713|nr:chromate transporter [Polynucleobacter sp.]MBU3670088.1 chromate transporter [Polynucleobacter sp.]MCW1964795.1 chromate transporter [Polynucleobacter sp.]